MISRELGVPDDECSGGRWALDHLFLDQDGIPNLVEVKRSLDSRIRREVVGQLLDYAANAVVYWQIDRIRAQFERMCQQQGIDPGQTLAESLQIDVSPDEFWGKVKTNLLAGRVRLVFVADQIPPSLQRMVEFLNRQMDPAEVLAVEIKQYASENQTTLVPRVVGQTVEAQQAKTSSKGRGKQWDASTFFPALEGNKGKRAAEIAWNILSWAEGRGLRIWWGYGAKDGSFLPILDVGEYNYQFFSVRTDGRIEIQFQYIAHNPPFHEESKRYEWLQLLNAIPGIRLPESRISLRPNFEISVLNHDNLEQFLAALDWFIEEVRRFHQPNS